MPGVSLTASISYKGVFDQSIYDQSDFKETAEAKSRGDVKVSAEVKWHVEVKESADSLQTQLFEHLLFKKKERLGKVLLKNIEAKIQEYNVIIKQGSTLWNYVFKPVAGMVLNLDGFEKAFSVIDKDDAKKELFKLSHEYRLLVSGIDKESVCDLEKQYVLKKERLNLQK